MTDDSYKDKFLDILEENIGIIIKISRVYTKVEQDKEDLINDITLELWKSFKNFTGNSKISTWIYRVALNTSMNYKRKKKNDKLFSSLDDLKIGTIEWLNQQDNSSDTEILYYCIEQLNELNKAIILLYLDGYSHDEISDITGISKTNVGTRIGRIKEKIRNLVFKKSL
ncbi:MAG TPA: sigma-70 family RNA polymerase sigma factor [Edaphocola sp.]|jgi:RNA polymerase sigma-70 factor (ECF subfamily)|nr:sigma-70 family RNA polymerase sigma factor [Edaphocola sp.]